MGSICFAKGELGEAIELLSKVSQERQALLDFITVPSWDYISRMWKVLGVCMYVCVLVRVL
jgi:hypothetical protein